ncbi:MAG TPA: T9SS type A sorting domain-containing protein, partial [Chitinophagales bacterium]|nr:T9SS type A sorting domain-containing protein [Chitinophagales bacterium]
MKYLTLLTKSIMVVALLAFIGQSASAATYTATASGNWSSAATWGGTAPGASITGSDIIVINTGVTVTLDEDVTINNASASLTVTGTLSGSSNLMVSAGTLAGAGTISVNTLTAGSGSTITFSGNIVANQLVNSNAALSLLANVSVADSVILNSGVLQMGITGVATLANNITFVMAGGSFGAGTGTVNLSGNYNLYYTGPSATIGLEASLTGLQNLTVNLTSASAQLSLSGNLSVAGNVNVQQGTIALGVHTLTVGGSLTASGNGSISGGMFSGLTLNGSGSSSTITFASGGQMLGNLTIDAASGGSVMLGSDVTVNTSLNLNNGALMLNGNTLTIGGSVAVAGTGSVSGSTSSGIILTGSGSIGTLTFTASADTLGSLDINTSSGASVSLGSSLVVTGNLSVMGGSLNLNGQGLVVGGTISNISGGSLMGSASSSLSFTGSGNIGTVVFGAGGQALNNLTINIGSSGNVTFGSSLTVAGTLSLTSGTITIDTSSLTIAATGSVTGGSSSSYVITTGSGSLIMAVASGGASGAFQVGTQANFAPVMVTNNSSTSGNFMVNVQTGVYANGTGGADLATAQSLVNATWNIESSISSGANVNLQVSWNTAMQVNGFDNTQAYVSHYMNSAWSTGTAAAATAQGGGYYSLALNGVTSFSPFAVFDKNTTTGISRVSNATGIQLYPNPVTDQMHVVLPESLPAYKVHIYDALGNEIMHSEAVAGTNYFNTQNLAPGVYFLSLNGNTTKRF